ncbi:hypothetical protein [Hymenobacter sp. BRD67]|uniref:hypothetical protein n=1 Tax=Hymenobacter sp. BRD67 TaxID=2675877 RepID=UPI001565CBCD|nr:hypothetical protein [Hymenobacter sp. BRD67]QKG51487.1 hypothetical protein GKZ67_01415 [Hymenobacter sp. BRD67]
MKSFLKLGSLFALIIAGRYMQLTTPAATAGLAKPPVELFAPSNLANSMTLTRYTEEEAPTITPINQRKPDKQSVTWF